MKVLHVSLGLPPFRVGGLTTYCYDLMREEQKQGHEVELLYPAQYSISRKTYIKTVKEKNFKVHKIINPLPLALVFGINSPNRYMKKCNSDCYEKFLKTNKPDVIHIHSIMGIHKEFFDLAHNYNIRIVFTTHDYYPLCIKCSFQDQNGELCLEHNSEKCMNCNYNAGLSRKIEIVMQSNLYKNLKYNKIVAKIRSMNRDKVVNNIDTEIAKKYKDNNKVEEYEKLLTYYKNIMRNVDVIHGNSELSANIYRRYIPNKKYEVIPITHLDLPEKKVNYKKLIKGKLKVGFLGGMRKEKGLGILIDALESINENTEFELILWGADYSNIKSEKIKIKNMGLYKDTDIEKVFESFDVLVVPSIWLETFGYVVLEALICNTPVIYSDCVGAGMLLKELPINFVYKSRNVEELAKLIIKLSNEKFYNDISEIISKTKIDYSMKTHTLELLKIYHK